MKQYYYVAAAVVIAAAIAFPLVSEHSTPTTTAPVITEPATSTAPGMLPPLPNLPEIAPPPDGPLSIPATPSPFVPGRPIWVPTTTQTAGSASIPTVPVVLTAPSALPQTVTIPEPPISPDASHARPDNHFAPTPPVPADSTANPPAWNPPAVTSFPPHARFLLLRGKLPETTAGSRLLVELMACRLIAIEGIAKVDEAKKTVIVKQGAIVRSFAQEEIVFVGRTRDDVCRFMHGQVAASDAVGRLLVARWCMFNGMREQALAEARDLLKSQPDNRAAAELVRSLEESLRQFPPDGSAPALPPVGTKITALREPDLEVTPEGATSFTTRVQPILANVCIDCHARPDYTGTFKLAKSSDYNSSPQAIQTNLRAVAGQLLKSDPLNSPFLAKAILAHGGLRQPPFPSRQAAGFCILESWVLLAVGSGTTSVGATPGVPTAQPAGIPVVPDPNPATVPATSLPPVAPAPIVPTTPMPGVAAPGLPSVPTIPTVPTMPPVPASVPPVVSVPPVLPTPTSMSPTVPSAAADRSHGTGQASDVDAAPGSAGRRNSVRDRHSRPRPRFLRRTRTSSTRAIQQDEVNSSFRPNAVVLCERLSSPARFHPQSQARHLFSQVSPAVCPGLIAI